MVLLDQRGELRSGEMLQKLIEQTGSLYHNSALLEASDGTDIGVRFTHYVDRRAHPTATWHKRISAGICKIGPFYATFFILLTAMNSTLVTACRLAFSSR